MALERRGNIVITTRINEGGSVKNAENSFKSFESTVTGATGAMTKGVLGANVLFSAISKLTGGMDEAIQTARDWNDWIGNNVTGINQMSKAVSGIVPPLQLARVQAKLLTGDFHANEQQLDAVSKAIVVYSRINKTEIPDSVKKVTEAITQGSQTALRALGINIQLVGTTAQKSLAAMNAIVAKFGDMNISAENTNEKISQMQGSLQSAIGTFGQAVQSTQWFKIWVDVLRDSLGFLSDVVVGLSGNIGDLNKNQAAMRLSIEESVRSVAKFTVLRFTDWFDELNRDIDQTKDRLIALKTAVYKPIPKQQDFIDTEPAWLKKQKGDKGPKSPTAAAQKPEEFSAFAGYQNAQQEEKRLADIISLDQIKFKLQFKQTFSEVAKMPEDAFKTFDEVVDDQIRKAQAKVDSIVGAASRAVDSSKFPSLDAQLVAIDEARKKIAGLRDSWDSLTDAQKQQVRVAEEQLNGFKRGTNALDQFTAALNDHQDITSNWADVVGGLATDSINGMGDAIVAAAGAAVKGGKGFGQAMKGIVSSLLGSLAKMAAVQAIWEFALALSYIFPPNPPAIAAHLASGALFLAVAAAAGVGAAATAPSQASSAGGGSAAPNYSNTLGGPINPKPQTPQDKEREKNIGVTVFLGNTTDPSASLHAQKQINAQVDQQQKDKAA